MAGHFCFPSAAMVLLIFVCFVGRAIGGVSFSTLPRTLAVTASPKQGQVLMAGVDKLKVSWGLNQTEKEGTDEAYKKVKVKLCYAPVSQQNRGWRKTEDDLKKDKTCQFTITTQPYTKNPNPSSFEYILERDLPSASYFVRVYALDGNDKEVAYGQTTDAQKTTNLFQVIAITGRHASLDIAAACFSAFSVVSLIFFFVKEKRKAKK
ncbi:High-affinity nitrate transporter protein [Dioscorea alata]|uniref:High-affinity nitrate transporter protein n=1 Tax=Dioscorea alata TaxID=55571 RepID=A0ACB7VGQ8_DIOAL|nr:High-affinity nitrate transporter protein [Dioscorea alata]